MSLNNISHIPLLVAYNKEGNESALICSIWGWKWKTTDVGIWVGNCQIRVWSLASLTDSVLFEKGTLSPSLGWLWGIHRQKRNKTQIQSSPASDPKNIFSPSAWKRFQIPLSTGGRCFTLDLLSTAQPHQALPAATCLSKAPRVESPSGTVPHALPLASI